MSAQLSLAGFGPSRIEPKDRLFFAIRPDAETAARIVERSHRLRRRYGPDARFLPPERLHVSLCHIGDFAALPPQLVDRACEAAASLAASSFDIAFDRLMTFLGKTGQRPLVLCAREALPALSAFRQALLAALARAALRCEAKLPFVPHLSLAYGGEPAEWDIEPVAWTVTGFVLVHSFIGEARQVEIARWPLAA